MNSRVAAAYPKWRRRCLECACLGMNSDDGIFCKMYLQDFKPETGPDLIYQLVFFPKDTAPFTCDRFQRYEPPDTREPDKDARSEKTAPH